MEKKKINRLIDLVNNLEKIIYEPLYQDEWISAGHWDYVSYSFQKFLTHIEEAHKISRKILGKKKIKFLDTGCGLGAKTHLSGLFFDSYGIELNSDYCKIAQAINKKTKFFTYGRYETKQDKKRIFRQDALQFNYQPYDIIYFFRPLNKESLQTQLEKQIFKTCKDDAIIIPIFAQSSFPTFMRHLPTPSGELYIKIKDNQQAKQMRKKVKDLFG